MKKVVYKLSFKLYEFEDKNIQREHAIKCLFSDLQDIESEYPLTIPQNGVLLNLFDNEYIVSSNRLNITNSDNIIYYTYVLTLKDYELHRLVEQKEKEELLMSKVSDLAGLYPEVMRKHRIHPDPNKTKGPDAWRDKWTNEFIKYGV